jgi:hypothetical protein
MTRKPAPTPEGALIRLVRVAARIRAPAAARDAGISPARWSQVENGYEKRRGKYKAVRAPAGTIAQMARAIGLSADRLEQAGRPDAAAVLREMERPRETQAPLPPGEPPALTAEEEQLVEDFKTYLREAKAAKDRRERNNGVA